jgi:predicted nucleic acid-binding protein
MALALYLDTSAVLRAVLEGGTTPAMERAIAAADILVTSRLSLVEAARALMRLRTMAKATEVQLADAGRQMDALWERCEIWELTSLVCETASQVAPGRPLRTLDALHLATYLLARRRIPALELLTADRRLSEASGSGGP